LVFLASFLLVKAGFAADTLNVGTNEVGNNLVLGSTSPIATAGKVIQVLLGLLGIIAVSIIIYGGVLWTTSGGSEEKINQAKKLLQNAVIGLIIILSAWGITYFILSKLVGTGGSGIQSSGPETGNSKNLSLGTVGSCTIESVYPAPDARDVARNSSILITAKEAFQLDTVCISSSTKTPCACDNTSACNLINPANIEIYKTADGNDCVTGNCSKNFTDVEVSVPTGNKTLVLRPLGYLGNSSGNVEYAIRLTNDLKKFGGEPLFKTCSSDFLEWKFETSSKLDLESPQVLLGNIFPPVDNLADTVKINSEAKAARATIVVTDCPRTHLAADKVSIKPVGSSVVADFVADPKYSGTITDFTVTVSDNKLVLSSGSSVLGSSDILDNKAIFDGYFTVTLSGMVTGNSWNLVIKPVVAADTLTVGYNDYIFVSTKSGNGNEILVPASCSPGDMATNMELVLSGNSIINVSGSGGTLTLFAKETGVSGDGLVINSNARGLSYTKFSGGVDKSDSYSIQDLKDKPMNSVIQVNFNEAMNPMVLSGTADEVKSYIRLVNANNNSKSNGGACSKNSDCLSYNCQATVCVGDYVAGKFSLNNAYKTLEFISNKECGVNSCGETMYCLPAGSHLALRINAAKLKACSSAADCQSLAPYSDCIASVCRDVAKNTNYPLADSLKLDGAVDLSFNSLDGNRDNKADGPVTTVYPYFIEGSTYLTKRDGFEFSFWISNEVNLVPPSISLTSPRLSQEGVLLASPVVIDFNDLMMNSTLRTGNSIMDNGLSKTEHKLINLRSSANSPLGYWLESVNKERGTADGEPDYTSLKILHSDFFEAVTYISQVGSGVKNIYQNCFKPSVGPGCLNLNEKNPSCCFGSGTNSLDAGGNCVN
jgi:Type IV secretion system pilin